MVLPIFPEGSLSSSVTTTVWVGVFVLAMLNLRFGWTLSGLVVPGYLVPLFILKPVAACAIVVEAVLAYFLVWLYSEYLSRLGRWSSFFGRDRFFALVLCSIVVKVVFDGYLLPHLAKILEVYFTTSLDFSNDLHSFGLIIVALIANQFWKPGLLRGLGPFAITLAVTYLLVRYPLMYLTNFSVGSLEYMYEDIASSILASPKAYIILLITAFMASRMNLMYSWDYNGILIPSLLALQWYEPLKILTSFVEAFFIYLCGCLVLRTRWLRETTVEGARKILLFFNISFAYKLLLGHGLLLFDRGLDATDLYGFGYLLPSLMAMKMHDKGIPIRLARTTLGTSFAGAVCACIVGFSLTLLPQWLLGGWPRALGESQALTVSDADRVEVLQQVQKRLYEQRTTADSGFPMQWEVDAFTEGLRNLRVYLHTRDTADLCLAAGWLSRTDYRVVQGREGLLYVEEGEPRGRGFFALDLEHPDGLLVGVPSPLEERGTLEAAGYLFGLLEAGKLAVATRSLESERPDAPHVLSSYRTFFRAFYNVFSERNSLLVRALHTDIDEDEGGGIEAPEESRESELHVKVARPDGLDYRKLESVLTGLVIPGRVPPGPNVLREATRSGYADLFLCRSDLRRLPAMFLLGLDLEEATDGGDSGTRGSARTASLKDWVFELKEDIATAAAGTNLYVPASVESLLFLDETVLQPLVTLVRRSPAASFTDADLSTELRVLHAWARLLDYRVQRYRDTSSGSEYVILSEDRSAPQRRYWGTCIFRLGESRPFFVEVPHPASEENTLEYGLGLFEKFDAMGLLIAGSHPKCNVDGTADVVLPANKRSLFNLVNQVVLRELRAEPLLVIQVRALGPKPGFLLPPADVLVAFSDASVERSALGVLQREFVEFLDGERLSWRFVDGNRSTRGYEAYGSAQARYLSHTRGKEYVALWLSPFIRLGYRSSADNAVQRRQFMVLGLIESGPEGGIPEVDLLEELLEQEIRMDAEVPPDLLRLLRHYQITQDINALHEVLTRWPELRLRPVLDQESQQTYLLIDSGSALFPVVTSLTFQSLLSGGGEEPETVVAGLPTADVVKAFIESGAAFLLFEDEP